MSTVMRRRGAGGRGRWASARLAVALLVGSVVLSGCDFDVYQLPLPGGADVGDDPITVTVQFADVLDLVPKSTVKVNDVDVGRVSDVRLDGWTAEIDLQLRRSTDLPDNAVAEIRQTSLLGEKFVSLAAPDAGASQGRLEDGDVIGLDRSGRNPEVEEVLGALSLLLNGGGVAQLQTVARELNDALGGREESARSVLTQVDTLTANLDQNKADIVDAIEALNRLAIAADAQIPTIDAALDELPGALRSIDAQRAGLVEALSALDDLSDVGVGVISQSRDNTVEAVTLLQPVLTELADSGSDFVNALSTVYAYPFVDEAVGRDPQVARNLQLGDYVNLDIKYDVDLSDILPIKLPLDLPGDLINGVTDCLAALAAIPGAPSGALLPAACTGLVGNTVLKDFCMRPENAGFLLCTLGGLFPNTAGGTGTGGLGGVLGGLGGGNRGGNGGSGNSGGGGGSAGSGGGRGGGLGLPLPIPIPGLSNPGSTGGGAGGSGGAGGGAGGGALGGLLGGVGGLLGGNRRAAATYEPDARGAAGPTIGQLRRSYDPDLVALLMPAMMPPVGRGEAS